MKNQIRSSLQNLSISYECALAIGNSLNLSEMLREIIHTIVHKTNAHRGVIWVKNGEQELQPVASAGINTGDVLAQDGIIGLQNIFNQILKSQQFVLRYKDDDDFLQYYPILTEKEESVLIVPVTNVAILYLVYASRELADETLANLLSSLSKKLSVAIEACTAHENIIKEIQVREKAEKELKKKTEQLISSEKELQRLYRESEQARKSLLSILEDVAQKEKALKESESKLNSILSSIDDTVFVFDQEGRFITPKHSLKGQLYTTPEKLIGKKPSEVVPSHLNKIFLDAFDKIGKGQVAEYDYWLKIKGKTLWFSVKHSPRFIDGGLMGSVAVVRDITERKKAEEDLRESEEKYRNIIEKIQDVFYRADIEGNLVMMSPSGVKLLGYDSIEEIVGLNAAKTFYAVPEERDEFLKVLEKNGVANNYEITLKKKDGTLVPVRLSSHFYFDKSGNPLGVEGLLSDITERKSAEEALRESEKKIRMITASANDAILMMDHKGNISYWNKAAEQMFDYTEEEVIGKDLHTLLVPERFHAGFSKGFEGFKETGQGASLGKPLELAAVGKDGKEFPAELSLSAVKLKGRWNAIGLIRDTTERKAAEEELKKRAGELEKFNKLAVGRELKMIELKKEINALLGESGKEPGYKIVGES